MKHLGLFLLAIFPLTTFAGETLFLRGHVPSTYQVKLAPSKTPKPLVHLITNQRQPRYLPKLEVKEKEKGAVYLVHITHP